jgi:hypothetical protein
VNEHDGYAPVRPRACDNCGKRAGAVRDCDTQSWLCEPCARTWRECVEFGRAVGSQFAREMEALHAEAEARFGGRP